MKKLYTTTLATCLALTLSACAGSTPTIESAVKLDAKKTCSVSTHGVAKVLAVAKMYNPIAVKNGVEFRRLNVVNREYIRAIDEAIAKKSKTVHLKNAKKKIQKIELNWATERSCTFALRALQQQHEAKSTWRLSVPGDGYKY